MQMWQVSLEPIPDDNKNKKVEMKLFNPFSLYTSFFLLIIVYNLPGSFICIVKGSRHSRYIWTKSFSVLKSLRFLEQLAASGNQGVVYRK